VRRVCACEGGSWLVRPVCFLWDTAGRRKVAAGVFQRVSVGGEESPVQLLAGAGRGLV